MKKHILIFALFATLVVALPSLSAAREASPIRPSYVDPKAKATTFRNSAYDTAGTVAYRRLTTGTFAQMQSADSLSFRSSDAGDSSWVRLYYVASDSSLRTLEVQLHGTDSVFVAASQFKPVGILPKYLELAVTDTGIVGTATVYAKTQGAILIITPGQTQSYAAHHYFGKTGGALYQWSAGIDTTTAGQANAGVRFQLRRYNRHRDSWQTSENGYEVLDQVTLPDNISGQRNIVRPLAIPGANKILGMPANSYVAIYAASTSGTVTSTRITGSISGEDW